MTHSHSFVRIFESYNQIVQHMVHGDTNLGHYSRALGGGCR